MYKPTKPEPQFRSYKSIREATSMTPEEYIAWRDSLPPSPVDESIRMIVRGSYRLMEHRIAMGNQLFARFRALLGLKPADKASAEKQAAKVLKRLEEDYKLITEGVAKELPTLSKFKAQGYIKSYVELVLVAGFFKVKADEDFQFKNLEKILKGIPLYDHFLLHVPGCGPKLSGMLLAELNPYRAANVSSFFRFLGLDVAMTGRGRGIRNDQMEPRWMLRRQGEDDYKTELTTVRTYNAPRKAKLVGIGMETMMKASMRWTRVTTEEYNATPGHLRRLADVKAKVFDEGKGKEVEKVVEKDVPQVAIVTCPYCLAYLGYKFRLLHSENEVLVGSGEGKLIKWKDTSDGHRHAAARRYMAKMFLTDLWVCWRMLEGLPITEPYAVAKLGLRAHHEKSPHVLRIEQLVSSNEGPAAEIPEDGGYTGEVDLLEDFDDGDLDEEDAA